MTHARWAALVLVAVFAASHEAGAAELGWKVPSSCASEVDVREQVERLIGVKLESVEGIDFDVAVTESAEGAWSLRLRTTTENDHVGVRELSAKSCREVVDAGAVAIAMAVRGRIDQEAEEAGVAEPEQPAEPPVERTPARPIEPERPAERDTAVEAAPRAELEIVLGLGASLDTGVLPSPTPGVELDVALGLGAFRLMAFGAVYASQSAELADGRGGSFELATGGLLICLRKDLGGFEGDACAGAELGSLTGEGTGSAVEPKLGSYLWRAARLELGARLPLSTTVSLAGRAGLVAPLSRPEFALDQSDVVHRPARYSFRGFAGLEVLL